MAIKTKIFHENLSYSYKCYTRFLYYLGSEKWSREKMEQYQDNKLKEIVRYASVHVPYYKNLFQDAGLDINRFRGREDMEKIPLLDKEILRTRNHEFISDQVDDLQCHNSKTSGSTGTPLEIKLDVISRINKMAASARQHYWAGNRLWKRKLLIKGLSESKKEDYGWDALNNQVFLNSSRMTKDNCIETAKLASKLKPVFFEGYARSFIDFYHNIKESDITLPKPVGILCYGESVSTEIRDFIESVYDTQLYDFYTLTENSAMICEMPDHHQYLMEDYFYPEIIDAEGNASTDGYGELVGTSFYNYAMPLIRYRTRDYIHIAEKQDSKRTAFRKVDSIEGRMDDYIKAPDGRLVILTEGAIAYGEGIIASQFVQNNSDTLTVNLVVDDRFKTEYFAKITEGIQKRSGSSFTIEYKLVSQLEKNKSGKTPFILSKIGNDYNNLENL